MVKSNKPTFEKKYAIELLEIAKGDLATSKALIDSPSPGRLENILYMIHFRVVPTRGHMLGLIGYINSYKNPQEMVGTQSTY
jgi:hypothetical protein